MKSERNSSIELLRIVSMFFIIIHHLILHNVLHNFNSVCCQTWLQSSVFVKLSTSYMYGMGG